jgi:parvulin-like peptidyl-prolyl isomerase
MSIAKLNQFFAKHGKFAVILLVLLMVVPLVFLYGVEGCSDIAGGRSGAVAKIDGKPVTLVEFEREKRVVAFSSGRRLRNDRDVTEAVIDRIMLKRKAAELGIDMVSDDQLKAQIKAIPTFQTEGEFDASKYKEFLENNLRPRGFTAQFFENVMRDDIVIGRVQQRLTGAVTISDLESFVNFQHGGIRFSGQVARYPSSKYRADVKVTDEEVAKYYQENAEEYRIKELLKIQAVHFSGTKFASDLNVPSDEELKAVYDEKYAKQIDVSHILKRAKTPANLKALEDLIKQLGDGKEFAELAKANSDDASSKEAGGSLGWIGRDRMPPAFEDAAFALKDGSFTTTVIETPNGYHVIKRKAERADPLGFDVLKGKIAQGFVKDRDEKQARENWLADARYSKAQLKAAHVLLSVGLVDSNEYRDQQKAKAEEMVKRLKLKPTDFAKLAKDNSDDAVTKTKGGDMGWFNAGSKDKALEDALAEMKNGEIKVVETGKGIHVVRKDGARDRTPFDTVRAQIMGRLRSERTQKGRELAEEKANAFLEAVNAARNPEDENDDPVKAFESVAEAQGHQVTESDFFSSLDTRLEGIPGSTFALSRQAVSLNKEKPLTGAVRGGNDFHVAVLTGTKDGFLPEPLEDIPNPAAKEGEVLKKRLTAAGRQARNDLISKLATEKAVEAAKVDRDKVAQALAAGKEFDEAKGTVAFQETKEFSPQFGPAGANAKDIADASREMMVGQLSESIEVTNGAILFYLGEKKLPTIDEFQERSASFASFFQRQRENEAMQSAFEELREAANIEYGGMLDFMNEPEEDKSATGVTPTAG